MLRTVTEKLDTVIRKCQTSMIERVQIRFATYNMRLEDVCPESNSIKEFVEKKQVRVGKRERSTIVADVLTSVVKICLFFGIASSACYRSGLDSLEVAKSRPRLRFGRMFNNGFTSILKCV